MECPEHNLIISGKSVCLSLRVWDKNFVTSVSRELIHRISWNFMFGAILTNWCLSIFGEYRPTDVSVVTFFLRIFGINWAWFQVNEIAHKFMHKIYIIIKLWSKFDTYSSVGGAVIHFIPKFLW